MKDGAAEPLDLLRSIWSKECPLSQGERAYLTSLVMHSSNDDHTCYPSQSRIAACAGGKPRRAKVILKALDERGLITRSARRAAHPGQFDGTTYALLPGAILALGNSCLGQQRQPTGGNHCTSPGAAIAHKLPKRTAYQELPKISAPVGAPPLRLVSKARKARPKSAEAPERYADVVARYHELYEPARGEPPTFGSRQGAAVKQLMKAKGGADGAIAVLEKVYAPGSWWRDKATIVQIASDPDKYTGAPAGRKAPAVQRGGLEEWEATRDGASAANGAVL